MGFSRQEYWSGLPLLLLSPYNFCALLSPSLHEIFPWYLQFSWRDLSYSVVFLYFFALISEEGFLISPCYSLELCIIFPFLLCFSFLFFSQLFVRPSQIAILYVNFMFGLCETAILSSIVAVSLYSLTWSLIFLFNLRTKRNIFVNHDILFGSMAPAGGLLKQLRVVCWDSSDLWEIFQSLLSNDEIIQQRLCFL